MWAAFLALLRIIGGVLVARRAAQTGELADLQKAETIHEQAAASRTPIADPDSVLAAAGRLRD